LQLTAAIVEHRAGGDLEEDLLRHGQPVDGPHPGPGVDAEMVLQPRAQRPDDDVVPDGDGVPSVSRRPAVERLRESGLDARHDAGHVDLIDEHVQARAPTVVGRAAGVEAEHVGTGPQEGGAVDGTGQRRPDDFDVERLGEDCARYEVRHGPRSNRS
jgi:hypothetical protein